METGSNISNVANQKTPDLTGTSLIIHLRNDGISLLIADSNRKQVLDLFRKEWAETQKAVKLIEECQNFFAENQFNTEDAANVKWLLSSTRFCLIPDILYDQDGARALLTNTCRVHDDDRILSDFWSRRDVVQIYAINENLHDYLLGINPNTTIAHNGHAINSLNEALSPGEDWCLLQVSGSFGELYIVQKSKVIFFNQFPHNRPEDLLYYTLATLEQNRLIAPEITLFVSGDVSKGEGLQDVLSKFIGKVEYVELPSKFDYASHLSKSDLRKVVNLIASL